MGVRVESEDWKCNVVILMGDLGLSLGVGSELDLGVGPEFRDWSRCYMKL